MQISLSKTLAFFLAAISIATAHADTDDIISWVRSKGGTFSDKVEIKRHPMGYMGVFAKNDIAAKESLFQIPKECYIQIFEEAVDPDVEEEDSASNAKHHDNVCKLAHKLMDEMKLGEKSEYAPYIAYLKTQKRGQLPANWSQAGKDALRKIAVPGSQIVDWIDLNFKQRGCIGDDPFEEHMVEMTVQRGFDTALIPIWDMVNHDNAKINTENDSMHDEDGMKVRASRDIQAGEEIYATYDECVDCGETKEYWGTPEILRDFGFVEGTARRWVFADQEIWFEIQHSEDGKLEVNFDDEEDYYDDDYYGIPDKNQIQFLKNELHRLNEVGKIVLGEQGEIPDSEWTNIQLLHSAAVTDILAAIEAAQAATRGSEL